jgi:hypothetical protein
MVRYVLFRTRCEEHIKVVTQRVMCKADTGARAHMSQLGVSIEDLT